MLATLVTCATRGPAVSDHPINPDINLLDGNFYANDVHRHFKWMRENAPVYFDPSTSVWGVAKHADVMHCSKNPEMFCNRFGQRPDSPPIPSMINMDDPGHKRRRNLVNRGFTPRRVQDHEPVIRRVCADLIETAREKQRFDFVSDVAAPLPMIVIGDLLGVAPEDRDDLLRWSDDLIRGTSTTASPEVAAAAGAAFQEYAKYLGSGGDNSAARGPRSGRPLRRPGSGLPVSQQLPHRRCGRSLGPRNRGESS